MITAKRLLELERMAEDITPAPSEIVRELTAEVRRLQRVCAVFDDAWREKDFPRVIDLEGAGWEPEVFNG